MRTVFWSFLIVLAMTSMAAAHDLLPPDWRGEPGTSRLVYDNYWYTPDYFSSYDGTLDPPEINYGPYWDYWYGTQFGLPGYGWKLPWAYRNNKLVFEMDNYDDNHLYKDIRVQVTFYAPHFYQYYQPWYLRVWANSNDPYIIDDPGYWDGYSDVAFSSVEAIGTYGWMCAAFDLQLQPNPDSETIGLDFGLGGWPWWYYNNGNWGYPGYGSLWIDQVVIDTRCSNIPEPSVFCLLAIGGMTMMLFVRRLRKA